MMEYPELMYIIPPYLLNTFLGSSLKQDLTFQDKELGNQNVIAATSPHYFEQRMLNDLQPNKFSADPIIHLIIKYKIVSKLAILGALGSSPLPPEEFDDASLFELFQIFKHRLFEDIPEDKEECMDNPDDDTGLSKFSSKQIGEIIRSATLDFPEAYGKYLSYPLRDLLKLSKFETNSKYRYPCSFVQFDDGTFFKYPLPVSWTPLIDNTNLNILNNDYNLLVDVENGYSTINLSVHLNNKEIKKIDDTNKYFNFISDKPVSPSCGVFYYEMEVIQEVSSSTNFKPIIPVNEAAIATGSLLKLAAGYTKRHINFESQASGTSSIASSVKIDLEDLKSSVVFSQENLLENVNKEDIDVMLGLKPGEFRGSYAVNYDDMIFHNSIKGSESVQRSAILNMNRRLSSLNRSGLEELDSGRVDMDVTFTLKNTTQSKSKKTFTTDYVGYGINFIEKSIFITLNGVLVKTITEEEINSTTLLNDNLFGEDDNSVYPMIGFQLNSFNDFQKVNDTSLKINTNLGFREFKFNVDHYIENYKTKNFKFLNSLNNDKSLCDSPLEKELLSISDDPSVLHRLIKGYLNHEGYMDTFKAFESDLTSISQVMTTENKKTDSSVLRDSHTSNRLLIKNYLLTNQFSLAVKFINLNYRKAFEDEEGEDLIFRIYILQYTNVLKTYLLSKIDKRDPKASEVHFNNALSLGKALRDQHGHNKDRLLTINEISALLLVKDENSLMNMPKINNYIKNYSENMNYLVSDINKKILLSLGFTNVSNLEKIVGNVDENIRRLSLEHNDDKFLLVNLERDYFEI